jgi:hypothetical protein
MWPFKIFIFLKIDTCQDDSNYKCHLGGIFDCMLCINGLLNKCQKCNNLSSNPYLNTTNSD